MNLSLNTGIALAIFSLSGYILVENERFNISDNGFEILHLINCKISVRILWDPVALLELRLLIIFNISYSSVGFIKKIIIIRLTHDDEFGPVVHQLLRKNTH